MLQDPKTVIGSDFDQETAEKIAPQFIARLELANCKLCVVVGLKKKNNANFLVMQVLAPYF